MIPAANGGQDLPQVFGRYLLLRRLSRGGMGEIFLARLGEIQGFEKPVIIKKILPNLSADDEFIKRFIDEAQVAIKLSHANIAPVYEVGKVEGDYFLALEYVEGRDLRRLIARCREERYRLPPDICLYIVRELASGLGYAHRRTDAQGKALSLVHCDISPPNVMVSFEGEVKIIDFGIAKSAVRIASSNPNIGFGKFGYMAPEQLVRGGVVDRRTDVYAAGVVLYELLTGERLFTFPDGADYRAIARMVSKGEFLPPSARDPGLDPSLDPIVCRALASRADDRYQSAEELRDAIQSKLSQINPTISADALAHLVKQLFADEIDEERALMASTRAIDVEEFREQLTGSMYHTVTYARAGLLPRRTSQSVPLLDASMPPSTQKRMVAVIALSAMLAGGALVVLLARSFRTPALVLRSAEVAPARAAAAVAATTTAAAPEKAPPSTAPATTPPPAATVTPIVVPARSAEPARHPKRVVLRAVREEPAAKAAVPPTRVAVDDDGGAAPARPAAHPSDAAVIAKFRLVRGEYEAFKGEYGPRLESDWNAIAHEINFGKPSEKYAKVNAMLDALRHEMTKVRSGG
jgi:serine/threonine-protein kinase